MVLGSSSKFSDLAHSARQSTVIDPNTDGQTTQMQSAFPHMAQCKYWGLLPLPHPTPPHVRIIQGPLRPLIHPSPPWTLG